jgi:DNA-binding NtrC family response regulator
LFGYEKGAFTGAVKRADGHLHAAHRGTLFLDEIGDMSTVAQAKVLRALETRCVQRVGSRETMPVDVRFVAATNQNLDRMVSQGSFRADLYFRVNVAQIDLPPLRERAEDIPCLVAHFLSQFGADGVTLSDDVSAFFSTYSWPGNIRELRNVIQSTLVYLDSPLIRLRDLPRRFVMAATGEKAAPDAERDKLLEVLEQTEWNKSRAAEMLHWSRMTLYRKMTKYQIQDKTAFVK